MPGAFVGAWPLAVCQGGCARVPLGSTLRRECQGLGDGPLDTIEVTVALGRFVFRTSSHRPALKLAPAERPLERHVCGRRQVRLAEVLVLLPTH